MWVDVEAKKHMFPFLKVVPAGGWYSITVARVSSWSEHHASGKPKKSDQQQTIIPFVCDTLIFESRCQEKGL